MRRTSFDLTYLTIDSIQEGVGSSQITPLLLGLAKNDRKICLISFEKYHPNESLVKQYKEAGINWLPREFKRGGPSGGILRLNELRKLVPESQVLHGRSDIPTVAGVMSRMDAPVLWDVRSLWSDQRKLIGTPGWNFISARGARSLENISASKSSAVTTLTSAVFPILENRHSRLPQIREVISTCVQTSLFTPTPMPKGSAVCLLSGTFNNYYDIERTRDIIKSIRESINLKVVWARPTESPSTKLGVGEDIIVTAQHSEMPKLISQSHFGIAILKETKPEILAATAPTKVAEFLASGRPMIVSKGIGDLDFLLMKYNSGLVIEESQPTDDIGAQISGLIMDPDVVERCRKLSIDHFDMSNAIRIYSEIYKRMLKESK
jgi:hypothetical protein